jgi:hypothetical protein
MSKRTAKGRKPKKVSYEIILPLEQPRLHMLLEKLIAAHHEELAEARIALAWCTSWRPDVDGRLTLGRCKKASDLDRELTAYDFVILLQREFWTSEAVTDAQRGALLDHELCHAAVAYDDDGEPKVDERGRTVYRLRKHDIEEFSAIVERHGTWKHDLEQFARAIDKARRGAAGHWIGYQSLRATLERAGVKVSLDDIVAWSEAERVEAQEWALLQLELHEHATVGGGPVLKPTVPAHVQAAAKATDP